MITRLKAAVTTLIILELGTIFIFIIWNYADISSLMTVQLAVSMYVGLRHSIRHPLKPGFHSNATLATHATHATQSVALRKRKPQETQAFDWLLR